MLKRFAALVLTGAVVAPLLAQETKDQAPFRVYFVGNSVTDTINYRGLAELAKSRGHKQVWGRHMIPGAPLQWIWQHPKDGFQEPPFGHYPKALGSFQWDALSLQPFDRLLTGKEGDLAMAKNFIDQALPKSPDLQVYIYARWPRQGKDDFDTAWLKKYTGGWDGTNETKDYFERLTLELRKVFPKMRKPILMIPVGHVMCELNQRMKAGEVPSYKHIKEVFADGIHLNHVGSYIVGCTFFATLYKENPLGLTGEPYKVTDRKLAQVIQETVWKVVSTHELTGVKVTAGTAPNQKESEITVEIARLGGSNKGECAAAVQALVKTGKPAVPALIKVLSDPRNDVRGLAAEAIRSILTADPSAAPNCHAKEYWEQRISQLEAGMPLTKVLQILFPDLSPEERKQREEGAMWSGRTGNSNYRLDDYWAVWLYLVTSEPVKLHEHPPDLFRSVRKVWVAPPADYTEEWVAWHVNGQKAHEIQYRKGQYDGTFTSFHDDGSRSVQQHYIKGVCHGTDTGWHRKGKKSYEGRYEDGKQVGTWTWWDENGQVRSVQEYEAGERVEKKDK